MSDDPVKAEPTEEQWGMAREWLELGDCRNTGEVMALACLLATREAAARKERDFEWWQAVVLNDAVDMTPEAAKAWQITLTELARKEGMKEAANAVHAQRCAGDKRSHAEPCCRCETLDVAETAIHALAVEEEETHE